MAEDNSFIREVNEEIRQEKAQAVWRRYGPVIIGMAIVVVLLTAAFQVYSYWSSQKAAGIGDNFSSALEMADKADQNAALAKLDEVEKSAFGAYPSLAVMRRASLLSAKGDKAGAVAAFDIVSADHAAPQVLRHMAAVRAAYILVDNGSLADVEQRVKGLATDVEPMRLAAREALGLAAWKAGKTEAAVAWFRKNHEDGEAALTGFSQRAAMMLDLIQARGGRVKE